MNNPDNSLTRDNLLQQVSQGWDELQTYLSSLSEYQFTQSADAAGWTVKDHVIHLAVWEKSAIALLQGRSQREDMDVPSDVWTQGDDAINAVLQKRYQDMPLSEVKTTFDTYHQNMLNQLDTTTEEELLQPYNHYYPDSTEEDPIIWWVIGNTIMHYRDHMGWMKAIVDEV